MAAYALNTNRVLVTVAPGKVFSQTIQGVLFQYVAGDQLYIPANEYVRLGPAREGIFL